MCEKQEITFACGTISGKSLKNVDVQNHFKLLLEEALKTEFELGVNFEVCYNLPELSIRFYPAFVTVCIPYDKSYPLPQILHTIMICYQHHSISLLDHRKYDGDIDNLRHRINNKK